jgi:D-apionolactonase
MKVGNSHISMDCDGQGFRSIEVDGVEVVRGVQCLMRDESWGSIVLIDPSSASWKQEGPNLVAEWQINVLKGAITGTAKAWLGPTSLGFELDLVPEIPVTLNRIGFVILHPLRGVAGHKFTGQTGAGAAISGEFPNNVRPDVVATDIMALTHQVEGITVDIEFHGDLFEMEDQRNWTDASFKTYSRPLNRPRPYQVLQGASLKQSVEFRFSGKKQFAPKDTRVEVRTTATRLPSLGIACEPQWWPDLANAQEPVTLWDADFLTARILANSQEDFVWLQDLSKMAGHQTALDLEIILPNKEPIVALANIAKNLGGLAKQPRGILAVTSEYMKSYQPAGPWPSRPDPSDITSKVQKLFPKSDPGYGMLTNLTELNRCPPKANSGAYVGHEIWAITHAADDRSVIETLEALTAVFATGKHISGDRKYQIGLSSIGMRTNPYGAGPVLTNDGKKHAQALVDPRHVSAFGAAYLLAVYLIAAAGGVDRICLGGLGGPFAMPIAPNNKDVAAIWRIIWALRSAKSVRVDVFEKHVFWQIESADHQESSGVVCIALSGCPPNSIIDKMINAGAQRILPPIDFSLPAGGTDGSLMPLEILMTDRNSVV